MKTRISLRVKMLLAILLHLAAISFAYGTGNEKPNGIMARTTTIPSHAAWVRYPIEGFAWPQSVKPGEAIKFYISIDTTLGSQYDLTIFRIPNQEMSDSLKKFSSLTGHYYPLHDSSGSVIPYGDTSHKPIDFMKGCIGPWGSGAVSFTIPGNWKSGIYYALLKHRALDDVVQTSWYYVAFVVRPDSAGKHSRILFKLNLNTIQAYNFWGGGSLYSSTQEQSLTSTDTIAFDRPLQFDYEWATQYSYSAFIRFLESEGYQMDYCNNIDIDSTGQTSEEIGINLLNKYKMLVVYNHDEYWSPDERNKIENGFKGSNVQGNIASFSPNTCY